MPLFASNINIPPDLAGALGGAGSAGYNASNQIGSNYDAAKKKLASGAVFPGQNGPAMTGPNSYAGNRLGTQQNLDIGGLESALGGGEANTAYQNQLAQRDFGQQSQIAEEVARLNRPDLLQQVLGGIGNVGGTAAQIYGAFGNRRNPSSSGPSFPQGQSQMNPPLNYPAYASNPYLNGGGF